MSRISRNWPQRALSRASDALVVSMRTSLRPAFCRRREGCPTSAKRVSHRQVRVSDALTARFDQQRAG